MKVLQATLPLRGEAGKLYEMHVCFVCSGNICRSPMAAIVFRECLKREGLDGSVRVTSAGIGGWHVGDCVDERAARILASRGYPTDHIAGQIDQSHLQADLLLALDSEHDRALRRLITPAGARTDRLRMLRSFDPSASGNLDVPDPYYGGSGGFTKALEMIEASMPGLLVWVRERLSG